MSYWGILPAAGSGARFGSAVPKQYLPLQGRAVLSWSLEALLAAPVKALAVALSADDRRWPTLSWTRDSRIIACQGGAQRQQSVLAALGALGEEALEDDWVMVHDAVRPCVRSDDILRLIRETVAAGADGGLLGWPADNALKRVAADGILRENVSRRDCWNAATPQMFRLGVLRGALRRAEAGQQSHPDESAAVMAAGGRVVMVPCARDNIKITHEPDLALAAAILAARQGNSQ